MKFRGTTMTGEVAEFKLKHVQGITSNRVLVKYSYKDWLQDGKRGTHEIELIPESLKELVESLESSNIKLKFSIGPTKKYLELIPTTEALEKYLEEQAKLPVDEVELLD